jgi:hypothetical protein
MMQLSINLYSANAELVKKLEESEKARMDKVLEESDTSKVSQLVFPIQIRIRTVHIFVGIDWIRVRNNHQSSVSIQNPADAILFISLCQVLTKFLLLA